MDLLITLLVFLSTIGEQAVTGTYCVVAVESVVKAILPFHIVEVITNMISTIIMVSG